MATKDPTVRSSSKPGESSFEGTHPAVPISEGADAATNKKYKDNPDKPDPASVAQVEVAE